MTVFKFWREDTNGGLTESFSTEKEAMAFAFSEWQHLTPKERDLLTRFTVTEEETADESEEKILRFVADFLDQKFTRERYRVEAVWNSYRTETVDRTDDLLSSSMLGDLYQEYASAEEIRLVDTATGEVVSAWKED